MHGVWGGAVAVDRLGDQVAGQEEVLDAADDSERVELGVDVDQHVELVKDLLVQARNRVMSHVQTCATRGRSIPARGA